MGKIKILHTTWIAFFISFVVWFNHAPLMATVRTALDLSAREVATLLTLNVASTIPARIVVGMLVDRFGPRAMYSLLLGIGGVLCFAFAAATSLMLGFLLLSQIDGSWPVMLAVAALMLCSFFVQAGDGAVFATVPLIKRRMTGQIAGMVGAYGNVGGVAFLTVLSLASPQTFFFVIAMLALVVVAAGLFLKEPRGATAEVLPDGTIQMIEVE